MTTWECAHTNILWNKSVLEWGDVPEYKRLHTHLPRRLPGRTLWNGRRTPANTKVHRMTCWECPADRIYSIQSCSTGPDVQVCQRLQIHLPRGLLGRSLGNGRRTPANNKVYRMTPWECPADRIYSIQSCRAGCAGQECQRLHTHLPRSLPGRAQSRHASDHRTSNCERG
jgi:hypothetical protein